MMFLFSTPDYGPIVEAAYWLAGGSVVTAVIWGISLIVSNWLKYR